MLKRLIDWLFAKEDEKPREVKVFDFTTRGPGNDITLRVIGDGEYAEGVVFLDIAAEAPEIGDFVVVDLGNPDSTDDLTMTFVVDTLERVGLGISKVTMSRYEGSGNE